MDKRKRKIIYQTSHRKLKIERHEPEGEFMCSGKVISSCSTCSTRRVTLFDITVRDICISSITILGYIHRPPCGLPAMITKKFAAINLINQETKPSKVLNNIY
jgi:hypothetical protein